MTIGQVVRQRFAWTWLLLIVLTVATPVVGIGAHAGEVGAVFAIALALIKVRLIGLDFMELRRATLALRLVFEAYCVATFLVLSGTLLLL